MLLVILLRNDVGAMMMRMSVSSDDGLKSWVTIRLVSIGCPVLWVGYEMLYCFLLILIM